ncbi:hypothetical protein EDD15DRAFT_2247656, partial [Pisolithus albus]
MDPRIDNEPVTYPTSDRIVVSCGHSSIGQLCPGPGRHRTTRRTKCLMSLVLVTFSQAHTRSSRRGFIDIQPYVPSSSYRIQRLPMATSFAPCSVSLNASAQPPSHADRSGNSSSSKNYGPILSDFSIRIFKAPLLSAPSRQRASRHHHNPTNL